MVIHKVSKEITYKMIAKLSARDHILYDSIYVKCPPKGKSTETESRREDAWACRSYWGLTADGYTDTFCGADSVPQLHCGGGCTTV